MKTHESAGYDDLSYNVVINCFNLSSSSRIFPDSLRIAKVTPIYKAGDSNDLGNYRSISVLPCFSKIVESIMYNRIYKYLQENKTLYYKQFGLQARHSTDHAIIQLLD